MSQIMRNLYFLFVFILTNSYGFAQGSETFSNLVTEGAPNHYTNGSFTGQDGSTWTYTQCRADIDITDTAIMIGRNRTPKSEFYSGSISGGIGTISFDYMQAFGRNVNLNILVNNEVAGTITSSGEKGVIKNSGAIAVNKPGDIVIKFTNVNSGDGQVVIDNVVWTGFAGQGTPAISISQPNANQQFAPATSKVDVVFATLNIDTGGIVDITVNGNLTSDVTSPFSISTVAGESYSVTVNVMSGGSSIANDNVTFSVASITQVADLAALRADVTANDAEGFYELMSTPTVTFTRVLRNQIYAQDASSGILIDDFDGTISTAFSIGDGISGLIGQAFLYDGLLQLIPITDASVVAGSAITPEVVTIATLLSNIQVYESELVKINSATFADAGGIFAAATVYSVSDGSAIDFRTTFEEVDYIGGTIPAATTDLIVLVSHFNGNAQITARSMGDLLSTPSFTNAKFNIYPNPTATGFVKISSSNSSTIAVEVLDVLGKTVIKQASLQNETLDVSNLNTGVYILKITQDETNIAKKLIIE